MKILEELRAATGFETFTCLTYGADLAWFESALLRPLHARGVRRFLIMADQRRISCDLESSPHLPGGLGLHYLLHGVAGRGAFGAFHPKLYLLAGEQTARLYIGSGNLTRGGLDRNLEVFERWDAGREGPVGGRNGIGDGGLQHRAGGQAGEEVVAGQKADARLVSLALADVGEHGDVVGQGARVGARDERVRAAAGQPHHVVGQARLRERGVDPGEADPEGQRHVVAEHQRRRAHGLRHALDGARA